MTSLPCDTSDIDEVWKTVEGYNGFYEVSNLGRVRSITKKVGTKSRGLSATISERVVAGKVLRTQLHKRNGYVYIWLSDGDRGKSVRVHKLVLLTFSPTKDKQLQVNHINGVKHDNRLVNLEWVTASQNIKHAYMTGLQEHYKRPVIQLDNGIIYSSVTEAATAVKCSVSKITLCCQGKQLKCNGLSFAYYEDGIDYTLKTIRRRKTTAKSVICLDTGQVYKSILEASKDTGCCDGDISRVCRGLQKSSKGLKFKYVESDDNG